MARRNRLESALALDFLARAPASSRPRVRSKSPENFFARDVAFAIWRQTVNITVQLINESNARKASTPWVSGEAFRTRSTGVEGTAPRTCSIKETESTYVIG